MKPVALLPMMLLLVASCSRSAAPSLASPPVPDDSTLSVLVPDGPGWCLWKRVRPGDERALCRMPIRCEKVRIEFLHGAAFATPDSYGDPPWVCAASSGATREPDPMPSIPEQHLDEKVGFVDGAITVAWTTSQGPSIGDRLRARFRHEMLPAPTPRVHAMRLTETGWQDGKPLAAPTPFDYGGEATYLAESGSDGEGFDDGQNLLAPGAYQPFRSFDRAFARLASEALPSAHPPVDFRRLQARSPDPSDAFVQVRDDRMYGPVVFVLRADEAKVAPQSPGESDEISAGLRGVYLLAQRAGATGPSYPRLWDSSTGELLWSDPNATHALFWPKR